MKFFLIGFLGVGLGLVAQVPRAAVRIDTAVLGFMGGPGPSELSPILGVFGAARISQPVAIPETVTRLYLSARQHYALVEQNSGGPLAVLGLDAGNEGLVAIAGALPHPDLVTFSPRGEAVALYSSASGQIQIISGMPNNIAIKKTLPFESPVTITMIALSDDANLVVIKDSGGSVQISSGETSWRPLYGAYSPVAWSFVPKTHDLIVSDLQENAVFLIKQADSSNARVVLAENCRPDQLATTSNGDALVALDSRRSTLWAINLKNRISNSIRSTQNLDSLITLRSGNTFLASSRNANPTLLRVSDGAAVQTAVIHVATAPGSH